MAIVCLSGSHIRRTFANVYYNSLQAYMAHLKVAGDVRSVPEVIPDWPQYSVVPKRGASRISLPRPTSEKDGKDSGEEGRLTTAVNPRDSRP